MRYRRSEVTFDRAAHEYWLGGRRLEGYTATIGRWMYPDTYAGAPAETLRAAAERGTALHAALQFACGGGGGPCGIPEVDAGREELRAAGLRPEAWEWLVDDGRRFASAVDIVFDDGSICDIKTTAEYHEREVILQLGFYAYLLERMNPGVQVPRLWCLWMPRPERGAAQLMRVPRLPYQSVARLVRGYTRGEGREAHAGDAMPPMPARWKPAIQRWAALVRRMEEMREMEREMRARLVGMFESRGFQRYDDGTVRITRRNPHIRRTVDTARLRAGWPEAYAGCLRETEVGGAVAITLKEKPETNQVID